MENGDTINIKLKDNSIKEGILMPSQNKDIIVLKLKNGYNIGFNKKEIKKINLIKKNEKKELKFESLKENNTMKNILILHTGGTIASKISYKTGAVSNLTKPEELLSQIPELKEIANIKSKFVKNMASDDLRFKHFQELGQIIDKEIDNTDGIIIGMGTDNLTSASCALSFILENPQIPILLVGSQRSSDRGSSDAALNLISAAYFIANSNFKGVAICMHESSEDTSCLILPSCKTKKMHSSRRDAFKAINTNPIAKINNKEIKFFEYKEEYSKNYKFKPKMEEKVGILKIHINMNPEEFLIYKNYKGLILEGTGLGHAPISEIDSYTKIHKKIFNTLKEISKKTTIVMCTNTVFGRVNMNVYEPGRRLLEIGIISGEDMLPETALIKLSWLLANEKNVKELIRKNLRGEINQRIEYEDNFLDEKKIGNFDKI